MDILFLNQRDVEELIDLKALLVELEAGFGQLGGGQVNAPNRNEIAMPGEAFPLGMPGHRTGRDMTVKLVTVFEENLRRDTGRPRLRGDPHRVAVRRGRGTARGRSLDPLAGDHLGGSHAHLSPADVEADTGVRRTRHG